MRVLCLHDVVSDEPRSPWEVGAAELESLLTSLIKRGYHFCDLDGRARAGERSVAVTIDDAPSGAVDWLVERAQAFGFRGTVFPVVDWLDSPPPRSIENSYRSLATWRDIRRVHDRGHVIGSHGMSHVPMHTLAEDRVLYELRESKARLELGCGTAVDHFAAPFGKLSPTVVSSALSLGYRTIGSTVAGINRHEEMSEAVLKRFVVRSDLPGLGVEDGWGPE